LAYAGLADSYVVPANRLPPREAMPKAKAAAIRALELDETLAEAHLSLGRVLRSIRLGWTSARSEYKRANRAESELCDRPINGMAEYLAVMGRTSEAIAEKKRAVELEPLSLIINFELGLAFYYSRDYDRAIEQSKRRWSWTRTSLRRTIFFQLLMNKRGCIAKPLLNLEGDSAYSRQ